MASNKAFEIYTNQREKQEKFRATSLQRFLVFILVFIYLFIYLFAAHADKFWSTTIGPPEQIAGSAHDLEIDVYSTLAFNISIEFSLSCVT